MVLSTTTAVTLAVLLVIFMLFLPITSARPNDFVRDRRSGISDQRLAELETLIALSRLKGYTKSITRPYGYGMIDASKIGRRKRSSRGKRHDVNKNVILVLPNDEDENETRDSDEHDQRFAESGEERFYRNMAAPVKDEGRTSRLTLKIPSSMPSLSMLRMTNDEEDEGKLFIE